MFTGSLMLPAKGPAVQVPPKAPAQVVEQVRPAGKLSVTVAAGFAPTPPFEPVMVYVTEPPGVAVPTPSFAEIARSAPGIPSVQAENELTPVTVAVLAAVLIVPPWSR